MDYRKYVKDKNKEHPIYGDLSEPEALTDGQAANRKKYLGVRFECCGAYTRAYKNRDATAYIARCPRCGYQVNIGIDSKEGTDARFFVVK